MQKNDFSGQAGHLTNLETFNRKEAQSVANYFLLMMRSTRQVQYKDYATVNHLVLELLRTEFHIK